MLNSYNFAPCSNHPLILTPKTFTPHHHLIEADSKVAYRHTKAQPQTHGFYEVALHTMKLLSTLLTVKTPLIGYFRSRRSSISTKLQNLLLFKSYPFLWKG